MADPLKLAPFPSTMDWDGLFWRTPFTIPWYMTAEPPELVIRPDYSKSCEHVTIELAPLPMADQIAAFEYLRDPNAPISTAMLPHFVKHIPELAHPDWESVQVFFQLTSVLIYHPSHAGVSYTGYVFSCLQWDYGYEHGVGIVMHRDRVVYFGIAEEARGEEQAGKDLRRLARARRGAKKSQPPS